MSLSNATLNLLRTQYHDDYYSQSTIDPSKLQGEVNDFQRILFRPRYAVQSRELTQVQTILQAQLERLGKAQFIDGDAVIGGGLTIDTSVTSGRVQASTNLVAFFNRTTNIGKYVFDTNDKANKAHVLQFFSPDEGSAEDKNSYLIYKQQAGNFVPGVVVQDTADASVRATFVTDVPSSVFHPASVISIDEGIFFVSGFFVRVPQQTIVLSTTSAKPSFRIGLVISEQVLDELDDVVGESLLDPTNNAPGAHRFRIKLTLGKRSLTSDADPMFIELVRVIDGVIQRKVNPGYVKMDDLLKILARRTYDESGDYVVRPFTPIIESGDDDTHFTLALGPGKAYVHGFEVETTEPTKIAIRKGRVTDYANNRSIPLSVGNYVFATRVMAAQPVNYFANTALVDIHCVPVPSINTTSNATYFYSHIGTAKVRMIETESVPNDATLHANSVYKLFFYDVQFDSLTGNVANAVLTGTAINVRIPIGRGIPNVNSAIQGVTVILSGASSPVTGTFTVNNYTANATCGNLELKEYLPTLPNNNTAFRLLFQTRDIDSFALYDSTQVTSVTPYVSKLKFQADVDPTSKTGGVPTGWSIVNGTTDNALLYQIPEKFVKAGTLTTNTAVWMSWLKSTTAAPGLGGASNVTTTVSISGDTYSLPVGALSADAAQGKLVIFDQTADALGYGQIVQFKDSPLATERCINNVSISAVGSTFNISFTYHHGSANSSTRSLVALARTDVVGMAPRQKTLMVGNTTAVLSGTNGALDAGQIEYTAPGTTPGTRYSMKTTDVFRIKKILYKDAGATAFANTDLASALDVTDHFTLDSGQRDNTYEYAELIVGPRAATVVKPTGRLLVIFDWFKHSGRGYASLDSYLSSTNIAKGMTYDLIPSYTSAKFQRTVNLRDVLDFRPVRSNYDFTAAPLVYASNDVSGPTDYLLSNESFLIPVSDDVWLGSYQYYLSRIDKLALGFDGQFQVIEGQDAATPSVPGDATGSLLLFQLNVPAYTLVNDAGVPTSVALKTFDHKRYSMQDLSKMDDRVAHLEYYTALNSLEQITRDQSITDADGNERFKNGILVDAFHGGDVGDVASPDFTASIDAQNRELRTAFDTSLLQFAPDVANSTSSGVTLIGDMAIPSYAAKPFITQPLATHAVSVNPFDVASFYGNLKLSPAVDIWKSVDTKPAQVIDLGGPSESWVAANRPSFVNWGEWEQTWSGVISSTPRNEFYTPPGWTPEDHGWRSMTQLSWNDVTTAATYQRQGTAFEYNVTTTSASLGNRVVDVNIVHNMRERDIVFAADGIKPQANLYAFFDGNDVTGYIQQANQLQLDELVTAPAYAPFFMGQTVYVKKAVTGGITTLLNSKSVTADANGHFQFELVPGQLVRIVQGVSNFDAWVNTIASNTSLTLASNATMALSGATLYTLTPVTVADVAERRDGASVQYTVKVVRARRNADTDSTTPYNIIAGSLRPEKQVLDLGTSTAGATLVIPAVGRFAETNPTEFDIAGAVCVSGVVRSLSGANLRFDTDISDSAVGVGTRVFFVAGPGRGQVANIVSYNTSTQTAVLDNPSLTGVVAGQTIYSVGQPMSDGFIDTATAVVSGRAGTFAGVYHLPEGIVGVGSRLLRLTDSPTNDVTEATTSAEANYQASGLAYTQQESSVSSRSLGLVRTGPRTDSLTITTGSSQTQPEVQYVDPLAETFLVDAKQYPQGVFVTSVDLCFANVPTDDIPVIVELRNVVNGYPSSSEIVPCCGAEGMAVCTLRPDQVRKTDSPTFSGPLALTNFKFPAPVHLMPGREYAIVVRSDSDAYMVYTAELGAMVIGSDSKVSKQPYAGSFFKSQNASTWTESPFEDLMFRLNRATWNATAATPLSAVLVARGIAPTSNVAFDSFEFYPHEVQFGQTTSMTYQLDIKPVNLATNDLTNSVARRYTVMPDAWSLLSARSMLQGRDLRDYSVNPFAGRDIPAANTVDAMLFFTTASPDVAPYIDMKKLNMLTIKHLISNMSHSGEHIQVVNPGAGYLVGAQTGTISTTGGSPVVTGSGTSFTNTIAVGDTVVVGGNVECIVYSVANNTQFTATQNLTITRAANAWFTYGTMSGPNTLTLTIAGGNGDGTAAGYATVGRDGKVKSVTLTANGAGFTTTPTANVAAPAAASGYTLTQTAAVLVCESELSPTGGIALTRYITRPVTLADGFDARDLHVTFDAYRPVGSRFLVYYKVLPGDGADTVRFADQPWRLMSQKTPDSTFSTSYNGFKEFVFETPNGRALDSATDTTDKFKVFAVKVVMASSGTVDTPRITNFRAIALDE